MTTPPPLMNHLAEAQLTTGLIYLIVVFKVAVAVPYFVGQAIVGSSRPDAD